MVRGGVPPRVNVEVDWSCPCLRGWFSMAGGGKTRRRTRILSHFGWCTDGWMRKCEKCLPGGTPKRTPTKGRPPVIGVKPPIGPGLRVVPSPILCGDSDSGACADRPKWHDGENHRSGRGRPAQRGLRACTPPDRAVPVIAPGFFGDLMSSTHDLNFPIDFGGSQMGGLMCTDAVKMGQGHRGPVELENLF